jgi:hypothetical protein
MNRILQSPFRNFVLGSFLGATIVASGFAMRQSHAAAAAPELQNDCPVAAVTGGQPVTQEGWDFAQEAIRQQHATIERLSAELEAAKAAGKAALENNPAAQLLAQTGHVMNEEQCRTWMGVVNIAQSAPVVNAASVTTVLYESGRASVNVSLLPLPGLPRVGIGPHSQLAPRWIIPGKIQPQMIGETRKAIYYYYDATSSNWQGPFAPERVVQ